ncbi:MAG: hypothetical protein ACREOD_00650 [Candidatus Dormibacteria bacterium]
MTELHQKLAFALIVLGLAGALWCLLDLRRQNSATGGVRAFLVLSWALILVQDLLGVVLLAQGHRPAHDELLHIMYGVLSALVLPVAWGISARSSARHEAMVLGLGSLLFAGLTFRALVVA